MCVVATAQNKESKNRGANGAINKIFLINRLLKKKKKENIKRKGVKRKGIVALPAHNTSQCHKCRQCPSNDLARGERQDWLVKWSYNQQKEATQI